MTEAINSESVEILIVGAGPAGSVAAALLRQQGRQVLVIEREQFPRFSIGESLLPQSMAYLEQAGMLQAVVEAGFQFKNGAAFMRDGCYTDFDFRDKHTPGWGTTYQVQRADFDHVLAKEAERFGAEIRYRHEVLDIVLGFLAAIIVAWFSRQREFRADRGSTVLLGNKQPMIHALARLGGMVPGELPKSIQAMGITSGVGKLFSTHPPIEERIAALQQAA